MKFTVWTFLQLWRLWWRSQDIVVFSKIRSDRLNVRRFWMPMSEKSSGDATGHKWVLDNLDFVFAVTFFFHYKQSCNYLLKSWMKLWKMLGNCQSGDLSNFSKGNHAQYDITYRWNKLTKFAKRESLNINEVSVIWSLSTSVSASTNTSLMLQWTKFVEKMIPHLHLYAEHLFVAENFFVVDVTTWAAKMKRN